MRIFFAILLVGCSTRTELSRAELDTATCRAGVVTTPAVEVAPGCFYDEGRCALPCVEERAMIIDCALTCHSPSPPIVACLPPQTCKTAVDCAVNPATGELYFFNCFGQSHLEWPRCTEEQRASVLASGSLQLLMCEDTPGE